MMQHSVIEEIIQKARGDHHTKSDIDLAFELVGGVARAWSRFVVEVHEDAPALLPLDLVNIDTCAADLREAILEQGVLLYDDTKRQNSEKC